MEHVLDVTLELLESRSFDDIPMSEILESSGQSAGQFYGRFDKKETVFEELCRRFERGVHARVLGEVEHWKELTRRERLRGLIRLLVTLHVEHRPVLRSAFLRIWRRADGYRRTARAVRDESFERTVLTWLAPSVEEEAVVREAVDLVTALCRQKLLFGALADASVEDPRTRRFASTLTRCAEHLVFGPDTTSAHVEPD